MGRGRRAEAPREAEEADGVGTAASLGPADGRTIRQDGAWGATDVVVWTDGSGTMSDDRDGGVFVSICSEDLVPGVESVASTAANVDLADTYRSRMACCGASKRPSTHGCPVVGPKPHRKCRSASAGGALHERTATFATA